MTGPMVCARCGMPGHTEASCGAGDKALPAGPSDPSPVYSVPPLGSSMPPAALAQSGAFSATGSYSASTNPASRALRMLKTQLNLAVGQREEDPERAWLELVSVRERVGEVADASREDPLLAADVDRFRQRLDEQIAKLTREVGDEVIAPLYSWLDLLRQRVRLERDVESARTRVAEARASRGAVTVPSPSSEAEVSVALATGEKDLAWWKAEAPPLPSPESMSVWQELGGDALRGMLPADPHAVRAGGLAARSVLDRIGRRMPGAVSYVGSKAELVLLPVAGASALLISMFALALTSVRSALGVLSAAAWVAFAAVLALSVYARQRADRERRAALDAVWHHVLFTEQAVAVELEVGWLRALHAALKACRTFDEHKGEGGQLEELGKWRPDLEPVVQDVAKTTVASTG
jgi:hypothetical protein